MTRKELENLGYEIDSNMVSCSVYYNGEPIFLYTDKNYEMVHEFWDREWLAKEFMVTKALAAEQHYINNQSESA